VRQWGRVGGRGAADDVADTGDDLQDFGVGGIMGGIERTGNGARWCILRTAGRSTLPLVASLSGAGFDVWSPRLIVSHRRGPARRRVEAEAPILATFVFARADRARDLEGIRALQNSPHPAFSIFRYYGRIPLIADHSIDHLRQAEANEAARWDEIKKEERRKAEHAQLRLEAQSQARQLHVEHQVKVALRKALRATAPTYPAGARVTLPRSEFAGLTGVVEGQKGRAVIVNFGGGIAMTIDAWLLSTDDVYDPAAQLGNAA
jgi:hypothetical protein